MIVVDASALATALTDDGTDGDLARARLRGQVLAAPGLIDLEVSCVLRRLILSGQRPVYRAEQALADLVALPMQRAPHLPLLARCCGAPGPARHRTPEAARTRPLAPTPQVLQQHLMGRRRHHDGSAARRQVVYEQIPRHGLAVAER